MKTARVSVAAWFVQCPHCLQDVAWRDGSLLWPTDVDLPDTWECFACGHPFVLPRKMLK